MLPCLAGAEKNQLHPEEIDRDGHFRACLDRLPEQFCLCIPIAIGKQQYAAGMKFWPQRPKPIGSLPGITPGSQNEIQRFGCRTAARFIYLPGPEMVDQPRDQPHDPVAGFPRLTPGIDHFINQPVHKRRMSAMPRIGGQQMLHVIQVKPGAFHADKYVDFF